VRRNIDQRIEALDRRVQQLEDRRAVDELLDEI
jgi:hypothetical protein